MLNHRPRVQATRQGLQQRSVPCADWAIPQCCNAAAPIPGRIPPSAQSTLGRNSDGRSAGGVLAWAAAADHSEAVRLAPRVHRRSQVRPVSWQGLRTHRTGESGRPRTTSSQQPTRPDSATCLDRRGLRPALKVASERGNQRIRMRARNALYSAIAGGQVRRATRSAAPTDDRLGGIGRAERRPRVHADTNERSRIVTVWVPRRAPCRYTPD